LGLVQKENETYFDFCKRLIFNRQVYDLDYAEVWNILFQEHISSDEARKRIRGLYRFFEELDSFAENNIENKNILEKLKQERIELEKAKIKFYDQRREYKNLLRKEARFEHLIEYFREEKVEDFKIVLRNNLNSNKDKIAVLCCADWHKGLIADNYWNKFNSEIFFERINILINKTIEYCEFHNVDRIKILNLGDLVHGLIHPSARIAADEDVIKQLKTVCAVLSDMILVFAERFNHVDFYSTIGNHSRVTPQKDASIENENFEVLIPWYLKTKFENVNNITINTNDYDDGIIVFDIFDRTYFGTHGDLDKIETIVENLSLMIKKFPDMIFMAHKHHLECDEKHKINVYSVSSLSGVDEYAKNLRKTAKPGQDLFIFNRETGLECHYPIKFHDVG